MGCKFMVVFFKVMDKEEYIIRMIDLKNGNWYYFNIMILDKRKDVSICICMYVLFYLYICILNLLGCML